MDDFVSTKEEGDDVISNSELEDHVDSSSSKEEHVASSTASEEEQQPSYLSALHSYWYGNQLEPEKSDHTSSDEQSDEPKGWLW